MGSSAIYINGTLVLVEHTDGGWAVPGGARITSEAKAQRVANEIYMRWLRFWEAEE